MPNPALIFLPGMGADARLFGPQLAAFPQAVVADWVDPHPRETLADYAARLAGHLAGRVAPGQPCVLAGASFGGFVAVELARHLACRAVLLIGSARGPHELPPWVRAAGAWGRLLTAAPFGLMTHLAAASAGFSSDRDPAAGSLLQQFADASPAFLRWACSAVVGWDECYRPPPPHVAVHQIHGARDPVLPIKYMTPNVVVEGGGHVLTLSHPAQVNAFVADAMAGC